VFFLFFLILLIVASSVTVVAADTNGTSTTATVFLCPDTGCPEKIDDEDDTDKPEDPEPPEPPTPPSSGSSSRGGSSGGSTSTHKIDLSSGIIPKWIGTVVPWWYDGKITDQEFINMMTYLLDENIIPSDSAKPDRQLDNLAPSTKRIFMLWTENKLAESYIVKIIDQYRHLGIW
jgi:hypothetical protein